jgi:hypothetical protein
VVDVFQFLEGEDEGRAMSMQDLQTPHEKLEQIMFREKANSVRVQVSPAPKNKLGRPRKYPIQ